jgi:hypothetical protein
MPDKDGGLACREDSKLEEIAGRSADDLIPRAEISRPVDEILNPRWQFQIVSE